MNAQKELGNIIWRNIRLVALLDHTGESDQCAMSVAPVWNLSPEALVSRSVSGVNVEGMDHVRGNEASGSKEWSSCWCRASGFAFRSLGIRAGFRSCLRWANLVEERVLSKVIFS